MKHECRSRAHRRGRRIVTEAALTALLLAIGSAASSQGTFSSTSTGQDGALNLSHLAEGTTVDFDPKSFNPPLDVDGDHIFHFTTITIPQGVRVRLTPRHLDGPVFWLAQGPVVIAGTIDLNGSTGQNGTGCLNAGCRTPAMAGAGGFPGGIGGPSPQPGSGPGGGKLASRNGYGGGGAGHAETGGPAQFQGAAYGNAFLIPLVGGSGGAGSYGGHDDFSSLAGIGGGGGGGAILIASSTSIDIGGGIEARGGAGGVYPVSPPRRGGGGHGSGGAIRLVAPIVRGGGRLDVTAPDGGFDVRSSAGRIRIEAFRHEFGGSASPGAHRATPVALHLPTTPPASLRVVSVDDQLVAPKPNATYELADVTIANTANVAVAVEARYVPTGTTVQLYLVSEDGADQSIGSTTLTGTLALSTATTNVRFPPGFSRGYVRAVWR